LLNICLILRCLFYEGIIQGQGGTFSRKHQRERTLDLGIETLYSIGKLVTGPFGHLAEVIEKLSKWSPVLGKDNTEDLIKTRNAINAVQDYLTLYDQAVAIWANITVPFFNIVRIGA
jgi:hypothetical protein